MFQALPFPGSEHLLMQWKWGRGPWWLTGCGAVRCLFPFPWTLPSLLTSSSVLVEGQCVLLTGFIFFLSLKMVVSFEPVQYEAKFHLGVQHSTLLS